MTFVLVTFVMVTFVMVTFVMVMFVVVTFVVVTFFVVLVMMGNCRDSHQALDKFRIRQEFSFHHLDLIFISNLIEKT